MASSLIDAYLPRYDVYERHTIRVRAAPAATYAAIASADLGRSRVVRTLLALRAVPAALARGGGLRRLAEDARRPVTLQSFTEHGFRVLDERLPGADVPGELVVGLEGRFWRPDGALCTPGPIDFQRTTPAADVARAAWNFVVTPVGPSLTELTTETRVLCGSPAARRRFLPYWWLIRPGSGAIRMAMLRAIRDHAERPAP